MTICTKCGNNFKLISRHTACKPPPYIVPIPIPLVQNPLIEQIKGKITYNSKWTQQQIDETVSYLVQSLTIDESKEQYPIKLDEIAKLLEYTEFRKAQLLLLENFKENLDYCLLENKDEQNKPKKVGRGGHNKKNYVLTSTCAKQLCMLSNTKKAKSFRMYFIIIEDLLKEIIKDPTNKLVNNVREKIETLTLGEKFKSIEEELDLESEYKDKNIIYFHKLLDYKSDTHDIYKYGITFRIEPRGDEHRKRFGDTRLIAVVDVNDLTYKQSIDTETSIRMLCKKLGVYHPYEKSNETFKVLKSDGADVIINQVKKNVDKIRKNIKEVQCLPSIVLKNPPYRKETASTYKKRLEVILGTPIKIKTFNYLMVDNDYDDLIL